MSRSPTGAPFGRSLHFEFRLSAKSTSLPEDEPDEDDDDDVEVGLLDDDDEEDDELIEPEEEEEEEVADFKTVAPGAIDLLDETEEEDDEQRVSSLLLLLSPSLSSLATLPVCDFAPASASWCDERRFVGVVVAEPLLESREISDEVEVNEWSLCFRCWPPVAFSLFGSRPVAFSTGLAGLRRLVSSTMEVEADLI